jgi:hypothetical protein
VRSNSSPRIDAMQRDWNPWSVIVGLFGVIFEKSKDDFCSASSEEPKFQQFKSSLPVLAAECFISSVVGIGGHPFL